MISILWVSCRKRSLFSPVVAWLNVIFVLDGGSAGSPCMIIIMHWKVLIVCHVVESSILQCNAEFIRPGLLDLSSRILGPNSVAQAALPDILSNTPQKYFDDIMNQIQVIIRIMILTMKFILYYTDECCSVLSNFGYGARSEAGSTPRHNVHACKNLLEA